MSSSAPAATPEKAPDDSSKLKTFLSILRKYAFPSPWWLSYCSAKTRTCYTDTICSTVLGSSVWQTLHLSDSRYLRISWNQRQTWVRPLSGLKIRERQEHLIDGWWTWCQNTGTTLIDRRPLQGQQDSLPIHQNRRISSDTDVTALANRTTNWGACWRFCGFGLPRTWYILTTNYLFREMGLLRPEQKYIKGKPCKPYNSTLGEFFRVSSQIPFFLFSFFTMRMWLNLSFLSESLVSLGGQRHRSWNIHLTRFEQYK